MNNLLKSIVEHEGFSPTAYPDVLTKGAPYTFGHGLTTITENESLFIVQNRITSIIAALSIKIPYWKDIPDQAKEVLIEMAYQMGVGNDKLGLLSFKKTLYHVKTKDYLAASEQMKQSLWSRQTPKRASNLIKKMASCQIQN